MVKKLSTSEGRYLGYEISGTIGSDQERLWIADLEAALELHKKVCVLLVLDVGAKWGVHAGVSDIKWVLSHMSKLEKIAVVTDEKVWKWLISVDSQFAKLVGIQERHFPVEQIEPAWAWLKG
ncbi:STAS/SEC14 domain-containing protein [Rubritalea sp.]|uniref:STAS/SEC14 domain-containing protein n=1 Tax=Rubritalea sp. TaxID=2109375 RepID=UPI003EF879A1